MTEKFSSHAFQTSANTSEDISENAEIPVFPAEKMAEWYALEKRDLPWRNTKNPYAIWISEIFLQQTQAERVIFFYERFLQKFPSVFDLANTTWEEFFPYFQGLGYYSRGKNMIKTAKMVVEDFDGIFPADVKKLQKFPGIGAYTAAAICGFAFSQKIPALDVNLFRVLGRFFGEENPQKIAEMATDFFQKSDSFLLNHALMDIGATLCTAKKVQCQKCPLQEKCRFFAEKKEIPLSTKISPPIPKNTIEFLVVLLHHQQKYWVQKSGKLGNFLSFPFFVRNKTENVRHAVQDKMHQKCGVQLSVRPECFCHLHFFSAEEIFQNFPDVPVEMIEKFLHSNQNQNLNQNPNPNSEKIPALFRFFRCQMVLGNVENLENHGEWKEISHLTSSNLPDFPDFLATILPKLQKMRLPKENHI